MSIEDYGYDKMMDAEVRKWKRLADKLEKSLKSIVLKMHRDGSKDIRLVAARMALASYSRLRSRPMTSPSQPAEKALSCPDCKKPPVSNLGADGKTRWSCGDEDCRWGAALWYELEYWNNGIKRYTASEIQAAREEGQRIGALAMSHYYHGEHATDEFKKDHGERALRPEHIQWAESICRAALPKEGKP